MRLSPAPILAVLVLWLAAHPVAGDAVIVTRAMTASTIMEAFVEEGGVVVELEVGPADADALHSLIQAAAAELPVPVPAGSGLTIRVDGRALSGTIEKRILRKRIERDEISGEPLATLPGVTAVNEKVNGVRAYELGTSSPKETVPALFQLAAVRRFDVDDLTVHAPTLEDVFLNVTGRSLRD